MIGIVNEIEQEMAKRFRKEWNRVMGEMGEEKSIGERMFAEIKTLEQAQNFVLEKAEEVRIARWQCDELHKTALLGKTKTDLHAPQVLDKPLLQKAYQNLSVRYGRAIGTLTTLMHCRLLNDALYNELRAKIDVAMVPTVTNFSEVQECRE